MATTTHATANTLAGGLANDFSIWRSFLSISPTGWDQTDLQSSLCSIVVQRKKNSKYSSHFMKCKKWKYGKNKYITVDKKQMNE